MSTTAAEVFDRSAYEAPEANLVGRAEQTENKLFSAEGRISNWHYNALFVKVMLVVVVAGAIMFGAVATESQAAMVIAVYYAIRPGSEEDNTYGAPRVPTKLDKVLGIIGMVLLVSMNILALVPMG